MYKVIYIVHVSYVLENKKIGIVFVRRGTNVQYKALAISNFG